MADIKAILEWVRHLNNTIKVDIRKISLDDQSFWFYDQSTGSITNKDNIFFSITGIRWKSNNICVEQPIIIQNEIGFLGIICKNIDGVMHYLMQAKIEPGNINHIQISPTIQATKSNFTQKHGGRKPLYLNEFINVKPENIIVDQIQSEQSSRFLKKRNRNIIIRIPNDETIETSPMHHWITMPQIKELMKIDNLVNMDARTVISCLPCCKFTYDCELPRIYSYINQYKMFHEEESKIVPLYSLENWEITNGEFKCKEPYPFKLIFADIEIEGREVAHWTQPLFEATGMATFGLITGIKNGVRKFLIRATPEIGCFDQLELGPTVQLETTEEPSDDISKLFMKKYAENCGVLYNVILSEEGGRFYHEQNKNAIIDIDPNEIFEAEGYFWLTFDSLNRLTQINNILNIQLRNLLSLLEEKWIC